MASIALLDPYKISHTVSFIKDRLASQYTIHHIDHQMSDIKDQILEFECRCLLIILPPTPFLDEFGLDDLVINLKTDPLFQWIPLIALSEAPISAVEGRFYDAGIDDIIQTSKEGSEAILRRLTGYFNRADAFLNQAYKDPLTNVFNRRYLFLRIDYAIQTSKTPLCLVFVDADHFKQVNDTYGHDVGDLVLQGLAKRLSENLSKTDMLARFGGEEYVLLLHDPLSVAESRITSLLGLCNQAPVVEHDGVQHFITFSAGICQYETAMTADEFIKSADMAAYKAKRRGRNQVVLSKPKNHVPHVLMLADQEKFHDRISSISNNLKVSYVQENDVISFLDREHPDVLLIDSHDYPNAFDLVSEIHKKEYDLKMFILGGIGLRQVFLRQCEQHNIDAYLCRPYSIDSLCFKLQELLDL